MSQYYTPKQQTQYVDNAMRQARVQARKAQQTGGVIPSVKGIRESVSRPTAPTTPTTPTVPTTSSVQTTVSVPTVRPPSVTSPALTNPNGAANIPLSTPKPAANKTYTANVQRANTDILNANKQKATADVWGTNSAPAATPLQTPTPVKASVAKINQTDYTKPAAGGILKPQAPVKDVPVSTVPVSNRTALFGAADTPDLTLTAKKLEQMGDLYRGFSAGQRALLDDYYKDDPASLNVIRGLTTGNDWLLAQTRAAQQKNIETSPPTVDQTPAKTTSWSAKRYNPHTYGIDQDGQLMRTERIKLLPSDEEYGFNLVEIDNIYRTKKWKRNDTGYRAPDQWDEVPSFSDSAPIFGKILFPKNNASGVRTYSSQWLNLSPTLQSHIYEMCKISGVDYYLVLATVAHESSSTMKEPNRLTASGYMQQLESLWWAYNRVSADDREDAVEYPTDSRYEDIINRIYDYAQNANIGVDFATSDASVLHKNALTNLATGIAHYYVDFRLKERDIDKYAIARAVGSYGEGIGSAASYEVLYYRDLLALANSDAPWYMGDLYDIDGKNLNRIPNS